MHATEDARNTRAPLRNFLLLREVLRANVHFVQWCRFETRTKVDYSADAENFIGDFYDDLGNVTKLQEFMETNSLDEPTVMHGAIRTVHVARAGRRQRNTSRQYLTPMQSLTLFGPAHANAMRDATDGQR